MSADCGEADVAEICRDAALTDIGDLTAAVHEAGVVEDDNIAWLPGDRLLKLVADGFHLIEQGVGNEFAVFEGWKDADAVQVAREQEEVSPREFVAEHRLVKDWAHEGAQYFAIHALE